MSPTTQRLFLFADEWLWIWLCVFLLAQWNTAPPEAATRWRRAFVAALVSGAVMVYGISYPMLWGWFRW